ncbi:MAG: T9SS type A sorting domain-containing protein [Bacteroidales bacterium]|nr:T9SS type A sorting domain-containing protein [Bacteroidales bacterium]
MGNEALDMFTRLEDSEYVIAPRQLNPDVEGQITQVRFYYYPYQEYNTASFTVKIYEGIDLQWFNESMHLYHLESSGQLVYSQDYVASGTGWQTITLDTPYIIPEGEFWVGVQMHGMGTVAFGGAADAVLGQYFFTDMFNYKWYWSPTYFFNSTLWQDVLYSLCIGVYVEEYTAVDEASESAVAVYPNPASSQVRVEAEGMQSITLYDLSGRMVRELKGCDDVISIDLSGLNAGLYFLSVVTEEGTFVERLSVTGL